MSWNNMMSLLSKTDKGQLVYGKGNTLRSSLSLETIIKSEHNKSKVFEMSSLKAALEVVEEAAFAQEKSYLQQSKEQESTQTSMNTQELGQGDRYAQTTTIGNSISVVTNCIETETNQQRQETIDRKRRLYENVTVEIADAAKQNYAFKKEQIRRKNAEEQERLKKHFLESEESAKQIKRQSEEQHQSRDRLLKTRIQEAENRRLLKLKQGKERLRTAEPIVSKCIELHNNIVQGMQDARNKTYETNEEFQSILVKVHELNNSAILLFENCRAKSNMEQSELNDLSVTYDSLVHHFQNCLALIDHLKREEDRQAQERLQEEEEERKRAAEAEKQRLLHEKNTKQNIASNLPKEYVLSVSSTAYHSQLALKQLLTEYEEASKRFKTVKSNNKLALAIGKAINISLLSITNRSGSDIKNQIAKLTAVLKDKTIKVGNAYMTMTDDAVCHACLYMAKRFVKQAEDQVSSNHDTAFSLALTLIGVWAESEIFGKLYLAELQTRCPFIIPWYVPQLPNQSDVEYNKCRGYLYNDKGVAEKQDKYLSRMSGLARTYAALIQSPLLPGVMVHPHGVVEGWKWLARMLNLDPWPEVTATVLCDFLEVSGHAMMKAFGKQFQKLLYALCHDYFPKLEEVSQGVDGPMRRLQMLLKDCIRTNSVPKPDGYLGESFINTYHHTDVVGG